MDKLIAFLKDRKNQKHYLRWLLHMTKAYQWQLIGLFVLNAAVAAAGVLVTLVNKYIVDYASDRVVFRYFVIILVLAQLFSLAGNLLESLLQSVMTERYAFYVRRSLFRHIMYMVWQRRACYHSEELLSRITSDVTQITTGVSGFLISIGSLMVQLVLAFFLLLSYSPFLAWTALLITPIAALMGLIMGQRMSRIQKDLQQTEADYRVFMQERITKMDLVKIFGQEEQTIDRLEEIQDRRIRLVSLTNRWKILGIGVVSAVFTGTYLIAFVIGAIQVGEGAITFGTMTAFISLVGQIQSPIYGLANRLPQIVGILSSAGRVMEITELPTEETAETADADSAVDADGAVDASDVTGPVGLVADHIRLAYGEETILEDFSCAIEPGQMVMIRGCSGGGKTTLLRAVMGFIGCQEGEIRLLPTDGEPIACGPGSRPRISYVPQGNTLFYGTIAENLRIADPEATDDKLQAALEKACAWDFVSALPDGMDTLLGEKAAGLSEGQAQRISIARALLKPCGLLILDEATSALDEETEYRILSQISGDDHPTCLYVSHRRYLDRFADQVIEIG